MNIYHMLISPHGTQTGLINQAKNVRNMIKCVSISCVAVQMTPLTSADHLTNVFVSTLEHLEMQSKFNTIFAGQDRTLVFHDALKRVCFEPRSLNSRFEFWTFSDVPRFSRSI